MQTPIKTLTMISGISRQIVLIMILAFNFNLKAQDKSSEAKVIFSKAEDLFNDSEYEDCIEKLEECEVLLKATNTKILFLKVKSLNILAKTDPVYIGDLQSSIEAFFKMIGNKSDYPQEKYLEIVEINLESKKLTSIHKEIFERSNYLLSNWKTVSIADISNFLSENPKYKYKKSLEDKLALKRWFESNSSQYCYTNDNRKDMKKIGLIVFFFPPVSITFLLIANGLRNDMKRIERQAKNYEYTVEDFKSLDCVQ